MTGKACFVRSRPTVVEPAQPHPLARRTMTDPEPLDAVLPSNMISVGLDVDRLGLRVAGHLRLAGDAASGTTSGTQLLATNVTAA